MLTAEENDRLTLVGKGQPLGELLRRYWHPIACAAELQANPVKAVRILGEDLTLFRDRSGRLGLISDRCAHRCVDLRNGVPDVDGLACPYHGWKYDINGQCIDQPAEPPNSAFKDSIRLLSYPVQELGGLVFAHLGPEPVPPLPRWDRLTWPNSIRAIGVHTIRANWLQAMENSSDEQHVGYLHGAYWNYLLDRAGVTDPNNPLRESANGFLQRRHQKIVYELTELGINRKVLMEGQSEDSELFTIGQPHIFPDKTAISIRRGGMLHTLQWRTPVDDVTTMNYTYNVFDPLAPVDLPVQESIPYFQVPVWNPDGSLRIDGIQAQDVLCWETQGARVDRTRENLASSDRGVVMFRKLLLREIEKVESGIDPMNVFRNEEDAACVRIPYPAQADGLNAYGHEVTYARGIATAGMIFPADNPLIRVIEDVFEEASHHWQGESRGASQRV